MKEAWAIWLEREGEQQRECVWKRKKDREKREQLCSCQRTSGVSDINLNILFKAFLHHGPWFISRASTSIYQNKLWAHGRGRQGKLKQTTDWAGGGGGDEERGQWLTHTHTHTFIRLSYPSVFSPLLSPSPSEALWQVRPASVNGRAHQESKGFNQQRETETRRGWERQREGGRERGEGGGGIHPRHQGELWVKAG